MPDHLPNSLESDDEDGFPWDMDTGGDLGNYDEAGSSWTGFETWDE